MAKILRRAELFAAYLCDVQPTASRTSSQSMLPLDLENPLLEESILENHWNEENQFIGLMVAPGPWMLAGPLGAWMAGRGYFALDTSHPLERIQQMTQDASPAMCFHRAEEPILGQFLGLAHRICGRSGDAEAAPGNTCRIRLMQKRLIKKMIETDRSGMSACRYYSIYWYIMVHLYGTVLSKNDYKFIKHTLW